MNPRQWRVFGALALAYLVMLFAAVAVEQFTPELGSPARDVVKQLTHGSLVTRFGGGYVEMLSSFLFLLAALLLAQLLRGEGEWTRWLSSCIGATAVINVASGLISSGPAGAAAIYDGHHGASLETVTALNDIRNFAFFLSVADLGVFTICVGAALVMTHKLPAWLGWVGIVSGALCVIAVAGARSGLHNGASLIQMGWWAVLAVAALRARRPEQAHTLRQPVAV